MSLHEIFHAECQDEFANAVRGELVAKKPNMVFLPEMDIEPSRHLSHCGLDSLVPVELRDSLASSARVMINIFDLIGSPSLGELALNGVKRTR